MMNRALVPAVVSVMLFACGDDAEKASDAPGSGDGDAAMSDGNSSGDGSTTTDGSTQPDSGGMAAVGPACGATTCTNGQQDCCIGQANVCKPAGTCPSQGFSCDGPEDCTGGVCCFGNGGNGGSECGAGGNCDIACHDDGDCPNAAESKCCPKSFTPNYKVCQAAC